MAKQYGVYQYRGKLGETVGVRKSAGRHANVVRVHVPTIANPKTLAQRMQRVKMAPATNFYRALAEILDHSWQGIEYGAASHDYFMKKAMKMKSMFPWVPKGIQTPIPGSYPISRGSLNAPSLYYEGDETINTGLALGPDGLDINTFGDLSRCLIENNFLRNGDQITLIVAIANDSDLESVSVQYLITRFVLDTQSSDSAFSMFQKLGVKIVFSEPNLIFTFLHLQEQEMFILGAGLIVSRPPRRKGLAWQRSNSDFLTNHHFNDMLYSVTAKTKALKSYGDAESNVTSDWYLNQGNDGVSSDSAGGANSGGSGGAPEENP